MRADRERDNHPWIIGLPPRHARGRRRRRDRPKSAGLVRVGSRELAPARGAQVTHADRGHRRRGLAAASHVAAEAIAHAAVQEEIPARDSQRREDADDSPVEVAADARRPAQLHPRRRLRADRRRRRGAASPISPTPTPCPTASPRPTPCGTSCTAIYGDKLAAGYKAFRVVFHVTEPAEKRMGEWTNRRVRQLEHRAAFVTRTAHFHSKAQHLLHRLGDLLRVVQHVDDAHGDQRRSPRA